MTQVESNDLLEKEENKHLNIIQETEINTNQIQTNSKEQSFNPTTYDCEYISIQRRIIIPIKLQLLNDPKEINILYSNNNQKMLSIKYDDYISIVDDLPSTTTSKIITHVQIPDNKLTEKVICRITHVPSNKKSKCNCCNCFFCCSCKCKTYYHERDITTSFFLISQNEISQIKHTLSYYKPPSLQELASKNRKRKLLFFVNQVSGTGKSVTIWNKSKEIFSQTDIEFTVIFTQNVSNMHMTQFFSFEFNIWNGCRLRFGK